MGCLPVRRLPPQTHPAQIPYIPHARSTYSHQCMSILFAICRCSYCTALLTTVALQWMLQNFCEVSPDYTALLRRLSDPAQMRLSERIVQFPFVLPAADEKSSEEIARAAERRREQGRKLQELAAKARLEKVRHYFPPLI